jgi:hypothetical protein
LIAPGSGSALALQNCLKRWDKSRIRVSYHHLRAPSVDISNFFSHALFTLLRARLRLLFAMKNVAHNIVFFLIVCAASVVYGANVPTVDITVKENAAGKTVKRLKTDFHGNFALGALPAGAYTLEFRAKKSADLKNQQFSIAIDGIKKSGKQGGISGDSLVGGVALNVEVASGAKVTGQFTTGVDVTVKNSEKRMGPLRTEDIVKVLCPVVPRRDPFRGPAANGYSEYP